MDSILVVEDKDSLREMLIDFLKKEGFEVGSAKDGKEAIEKLRDGRFSVMLLDLKIPKVNGMQVLKESSSEEVTTIIMTAYGTIETAVEAMKLGAFDFISKPVDLDHIILLIRRALEQKRIVRENILLKTEFADRFQPTEIISKSKSMVEVAALAQRVAASTSNVLILGESGTGKELFARSIHSMSPRKDYPFVPINCAAIPKDLLENELFGSERGAFTGAVRKKIGKFEFADRGTVFLDEIGDLNLSLQAKILRVIQEKSFERLGGTKNINVDLRIIAASNKDLKAAIGKGNFRDDLYYRLSVFPILLPPLRERKEDIPLLASYFIQKYTKEIKKGPFELSDEAKKVLLSYDWPGNVRELENTIERAIILCDGRKILSKHIVILPVTPAPSISLSNIPKDNLRAAGRWGARVTESQVIKGALIEYRGNKTKVAKALKVSYKTLLEKIKEYKI